MTTLQVLKLRMYIALRILLRANPAILAKLPNADELLIALDNAIADIQANDLLKKKTANEIREIINALRTNLTRDILSTSRKIQAYADYKKDKALLKDTKYTDSSLSGLSDVELVQVAKSLHATVNLYLTELQPYELNAETQKTLLDDATLYETSSPQLDAKNREQTNLTALIAENYKTADGIVASLDKLVEIVRDTEPAFYKEYKKTRKVEVPKDVVQLVAKILDAVTGAGIPNATVTFTQTDATADPIVKQTADKGGFQIKSLPNGIYSVTVVKLGYLTQTISIIVTGDEPYSLEVKMVKG
jgi:hypothetical protein